MELVSNKLPDLSKVPAIDEVGVNERVARFQTRSIKSASKIEARIIGSDPQILRDIAVQVEDIFSADSGSRNVRENI